MGTFFDDGCGSDGSYIIEAGQFSEFGISAPKEEGQPKLAKRYLRSRGFHCLSAYTADRKSAEAIFKNPRISRVSWCRFWCRFVPVFGAIVCDSMRSLKSFKSNKKKELCYG